MTTPKDLRERARRIAINFFDSYPRTEDLSDGIAAFAQEIAEEAVKDEHEEMAYCISSRQEAEQRVKVLEAALAESVRGLEHIKKLECRGCAICAINIPGRIKQITEAGK